MTEELTGCWIECIVDNDYEIWSEYPHPIRRKGSDKVIKETIHKSTGYVVCYLNHKHYLKHRIVALQFIPNPDNLPQVDHINRIRTDNRLLNLRWVNRSENQWNRTSHKNNIVYEYFDEIPCENEEDIIEVRDYGTHQFEDLYYHDNWFYFWNGFQFKRLHIGYRRNGLTLVQVQDINERWCSIIYSKFKRLYDVE